MREFKKVEEAVGSDLTDVCQCEDIAIDPVAQTSWETLSELIQAVRIFPSRTSYLAARGDRLFVVTFDEIDQDLSTEEFRLGDVQDVRVLPLKNGSGARLTFRHLDDVVGLTMLAHPRDTTDHAVQTRCRQQYNRLLRQLQQRRAVSAPAVRDRATTTC